MSEQSTQWTCAQVRARIDDFILSNLSTQESQQILTHAQNCQDCRRAIQVTERLINALQGPADSQASSRLEASAAAIRKRALINAGIRNRDPLRRLRFGTGALAIAASLAFVVMNIGTIDSSRSQMNIFAPKATPLPSATATPPSDVSTTASATSSTTSVSSQTTSSWN